MLFWLFVLSALAGPAPFHVERVQPGLMRVSHPAAQSSTFTAPAGDHVVLQGEASFTVLSLSKLSSRPDPIPGRLIGQLPYGEWLHRTVDPGATYAMDLDTGERRVVILDAPGLTPMIVAGQLAAQVTRTPAWMAERVPFELTVDEHPPRIVRTPAGDRIASRFGRYVSYQRGGPDEHVVIYDLKYGISRSVDLHDAQTQIAWLGKERLLVHSEARAPFGKPGDPPAASWLSLVNAHTAQPIWQVPGSFSREELMMDTKRLAYLNEGEGLAVDLDSGETSAVDTLRGELFAVDRSGWRLAMLGPGCGERAPRGTPCALQVGIVFGPRVTVLELPAGSPEQDGPRFVRPPLWTANGEHVLLFEDEHFWVVSLGALERAELHTRLRDLAPSTARSATPPPFLQAPFVRNWEAVGWWGDPQTGWVGAIRGVEGRGRMHIYTGLVVTFEGDVLIQPQPNGSHVIYVEGHAEGRFFDPDMAGPGCKDGFRDLRRMLIHVDKDGTVWTMWGSQWDEHGPPAYRTTSRRAMGAISFMISPYEYPDRCGRR